MMQVLGYEFREGTVFQRGAKPDANIVGRHIDFLRESSKGELLPEDLVADARNHNSPLHQLFEWDDTAAAEAFRLQQARGLIRCVVALYRPETNGAHVVAPVKIAAFTRIPEGETSHYRATHHALAQKQTRQAILQQAWRELQNWKSRYRHLKEFADLVEMADEIGLKLKLPA